MLTLYQLKQKPIIKGVYRQPAYLRNFVLLLVLVFVLFIIDVIILRPEGGNIQTVFKILVGLNSKVFNYIQNHQEELFINDSIELPNYDINDDLKISAMAFMQSCVRINRPCTFLNMAANWKITTQLKKDQKSIQNILSGITVDTYNLTENPEPLIPSRGWSFSEQHKDQTKIEPEIEWNKDLNIKAQSEEITERLKDYIEVPEFYDDFADLQNIQIYHGSHFIDRPQYQREEQMFCAVRGRLSFVLVPHIYRHEVYAGTLDPSSIYYEHLLQKEEQTNISPVNFWVQFSFAFPHFGHSPTNVVNLKEGDCIFIPAYYFYHMQGFHSLKQPTDRQFPKVYEHEKQMGGEANQDYSKVINREIYSDDAGTALSLKFEGNSELLQNFIDSIEKKHIH